MKLVDPDLKYLTMSEEDLASLYCSWYPPNSNGSASRTICSLIEAVAKLRGFDVNKWIRG